MLFGPNTDMEAQLSTSNGFSMTIGGLLSKNLLYRVSSRATNRSIHIQYRSADIIEVGRYHCPLELQFSPSATVRLCATAHPRR